MLVWLCKYSVDLIRLSLKRGFGGCRHGFGGCDRFGGLSGFNGFGGFSGLIFFNIFLADLLFILNKIDIANYADGITPYTSSSDVNRLIKSLEEASKELFKWFDGNLMKSNPDNYHLLVSTNGNVAIRIGNFKIENTKREKLLGIQFDNKQSFDYHLSEICKKASRKCYALGRVTPYMNLSKRKILMILTRNSVIAHLYECVLVASLTKK